MNSIDNINIFLPQAVSKYATYNAFPDTEYWSKCVFWLLQPLRYMFIQLIRLRYVCTCGFLVLRTELKIKSKIFVLKKKSLSFLRAVHVSSLAFSSANNRCYLFLSGFNTCQDTLTAVELRTVTCKVGAERGTVSKEVDISYLTLQEIQL